MKRVWKGGYERPPPPKPARARARSPAAPSRLPPPLGITLPMAAFARCGLFPPAAAAKTNAGGPPPGDVSFTLPRADAARLQQWLARGRVEVVVEGGADARLEISQPLEPTDLFGGGFLGTAGGGGGAAAAAQARRPKMSVGLAPSSYRVELPVRATERLRERERCSAVGGAAQPAAARRRRQIRHPPPLQTLPSPTTARLLRL